MRRREAEDPNMETCSWCDAKIAAVHNVGTLDAACRPHYVQHFG